MKEYDSQADSASLLSLLDRQRKVWKPVDDNYRSLESVRQRELPVNGFLVRLQYNPGRMASSAAKTDPNSIRDRKCFLCAENRAAMQEGIPFGKDYTVLINPFPIFLQHFTIPVRTHVPQRIFGRYEDMLEMARGWDRFVIFYNGPCCGASAPDHAHFQAGNKGFLPLEKEWGKIEKEWLKEKTEIKLFRLANYGRNAFGWETASSFEACNVFYSLYDLLALMRPGDEEPLMNLIVWFEEGRWITCLFPRAKHRPACYFAEEENRKLISPGCVDMGGVWVLPLKKDFDLITEKDVHAVYKEVSLSDEDMHRIIKRIK